MKITGIKQQVKNPERVSIFVDGKYSFSLTLNELLTEKLKVGTEVDEAQVKTLKKLSEEGKLKMRALAWLMGRPHSIREFRDYMYRKKADQELIDAWVEDFEAKNYLDDHKFAVWWAEGRAQHNRSNRFIQSELYKKGVSKDIVEEVLADSEDDEKTRLQELIAKKGHLKKYQDDPQKFMQFLIRQGFSYSLVKEALGRAGDGAD